MNDTGYLREEPPSGSVVAIDWGGPRQEVWVSSRSNIGNWSTSDIRQEETWCLRWEDIVARAQPSGGLFNTGIRTLTLTLLVAGDKDTYALGYDAGCQAAAAAITEALDNMPRPPRTSPR